MPPVSLDLRSAEDMRDVVHRAVQALVEGQLVAFPTETVYSLAASALDEPAVNRLIAAKRRPADKPLTLAVKSAEDALDFVPRMSPLALRLARRCWPGPVTLLMQDADDDSLVQQLPGAVQQVILPHGELGLRVPAHTSVLEALRLLAGPLVLTGAHREGKAPSLTALEVSAALGDDVQLILDDGRSRYGQPSSIVRVGPHGYELVRAGVVNQQHLKRLSCMLVLFVCTGNTCRSPMAEGLCRRLLAERLQCEPKQLEDRGVTVMSAGIAAMAGGRPSPEAVHVMKNYGINIEDHESQPLTAQLARHADVIFVMTRSHRQAILAEWSDAADRVALLCQDQSDIPDPIGGPPELYQRCADRMKAEIEPWVRQLPLPPGP